MKGRWTLPSDIWPSSHLIRADHSGLIQTRCGLNTIVDPRTTQTTGEPPARGRTCESCLRYSRRDG